MVLSPTSSGLVNWRDRRLERDRVRFEEAVRLLAAAVASSTMLPPLEEIAGKTGYSTVARMDRSFRRWSGITAYRYWLWQRQNPRAAAPGPRTRSF